MLLPYNLVLETPQQEEDKDFALRFPSSTLLCSDLDEMIVEGKFLEQFIGDDPFCFDEEALQKRNLVKDVSPIAPPGDGSMASQNMCIQGSQTPPTFMVTTLCC